jgi:hypothetical protein
MAYHKILLGGDPEIEEFPAAAAITPGMLVYLNSSGQVAVQVTAGANVMPWFALESLDGDKTIDDAYAQYNRVRVAKCKGGEKIYAYLVNGDGAVHVGDWLESGGSGYVREVDADASAGAIAVSSVLGTVREAADSTSAAVRIVLDVK